MKKHTWKIIGLLALVAIAGSIVYANKAAKEANEGVEITNHIKGNPDASVTLVEYSDFQCPACGQFYPYVKQVVEEEGDNIRFEYRHFPLITIHPNAVPGAIASEAAAQQGKFWEMHDKLFENQSEWSNASNPRSYFIKYAEEIGLDMGTFKRHLDSSIIADAITDSFNEARGFGFTGTPSFLLNGQKMQFETFNDFLTQIEEAVNNDSN